MLFRAGSPSPSAVAVPGKKRRRWAIAAAAAVAAVLESFPARAATYTAADTFALNPSGYSLSQAAGIFANQQVGYGVGSSGYNALLWSGTAASAVDLNPAGYSNSFATGISDGQEVGYGNVTGTAVSIQALLWSGSASSFVDLNPAGFTSAHAYANSGSQQVGDGYGSPTGGNDNALLWTGSAAGYVNLNPSGFTQSQALATDGANQVGEGVSPATGNENAILWSGTASSYVNLNPVGYTASFANGVSGSQQVGEGYGTLTFYNEHALLWTGSAAGYIDLNPTNFTQSEALATNSAQQVGDGYGSATGNDTHALVWSGSAASYVDLSSLIPGTSTYSYATGIDMYGNIAGYSESAAGTVAVEWLAGDTYSITAGGTAWNSASTWLSGIPAAGNNVLLISSDGLSRTITYANPTPSLVLGTLTIDALNGGSMILSQSQNNLSAAAVYLGGSAISAGGTGVLTVSNTGTLTVTGSLTVWNHGRANLDVPATTVGGLSIIGTGIVNLNGSLNVDYGSPANDPIASIVSCLQTGYNSGAWTGTAGIISTSAAASFSPLLSLGYADGNKDMGTSAAPNQVLIKLTLAGDALLAGTVNFNDLDIVGRYLNTTGNDWAQGNFTYAPNGAVTFNDLDIIGQNLNQAFNGAAMELGGTTLPLDAAAGIQNTLVVPEPAPLALTAIAAAGLLLRRGKKIGFALF
jgi:hypothetical protein